MKREWRRFAPIGLFLSLLAALTTIGLLIVFREFNLYAQIALAVTMIGLALFAALDPDRVRIALTGRQARYGSNALVMTLAFVGILAVVNYLAYENPKRWDLTEDSEHSLAKETIETLKSLPEPVEALAFYPAGTNTENAQKILDDYEFYGEDNFSYRFIDPNADPVAARSANVPLEAAGTIVLRMDTRQEKVTAINEQQMTGAMVRLMSEEMSVYFLIGHDEYSPEASGDEAYSQAKKALESKNYTVHTLNLLAQNVIPEDADVIVIAGPKKPVTETEVELLANFLDAGGSLVVMEEPVLLTEYGEASDPLASYLESSWGIKLGQDIVIDYSSEQPFNAYAAAYSSEHMITSKMQQLTTAFPTVRSVQAVGSESITPEELIFTASQSWAESDTANLEAGLQPNPDEGVDLIGNIPLAAAAERADNGARVVVFGDADFAIDANFTVFGNGDMFVNSVDWATEQENLINLTPKNYTERFLLQPRIVTQGLIWLGSVILPAGLVVATGVVVGIRRRKQG